MNLLALLISTGINILNAPFSDNTREVQSGRERRQDLSIFPFNILKRTPACTTLTLTLGDNQVKFTTIPRGFCSNCCQSKLDRDIRFLLFRKGGPVDGQIIKPFNQPGAARRAGVNPKWKTIIYIHGFTETSPGVSGGDVVEAYMSRPGNYNVIILDWSELCAFPWYRTAVQNVKVVGEVLREFITTFHKSQEIPVQNLHVIGFSLGCHVASMAGKHLQGEFRLPRITALDPAYPEFPITDRTKRLANTDADYIDVIHTDGGIFGYPESLGHADFYPNGGRALQPGCQPSYLASQNILDEVLACSHVRAWKLYTESVLNPSAFPATQCSNWSGENKECDFTTDSYMGFASNNSMIGTFYLKTGYRSPYGMDTKEQQ